MKAIIYIYICIYVCGPDAGGAREPSDRIRHSGRKRQLKTLTPTRGETGARHQLPGDDVKRPKKRKKRGGRGGGRGKRRPDGKVRVRFKSKYKQHQQFHQKNKRSTVIVSVGKRINTEDSVAAQRQQHRPQSNRDQRTTREQGTSARAPRAISLHLISFS